MRSADKGLFITRPQREVSDEKFFWKIDYYDRSLEVGSEPERSGDHDPRPHRDAPGGALKTADIFAGRLQAQPLRLHDRNQGVPLPAASDPARQASRPEWFVCRHRHP